MGRRPCCVKEGLNRGAWNAREDELLTNYIKLNGEGNWRDLPQKAGLNRCGKSCRLRWLNYLTPDIKRGNISVEEEELIAKLHKLLGNRWSLIAGRLPGRTDNEIKNYWNTNLSKRVAQEDKIPRSPKKKHVLIPAKHKDNMCDNYRPHEVIRTKAVRCTGVVNILPRRPVPLYTDKNIDNSNSPEGYVGSNGGNPNDHNINSNSSGILGDDDDLLMDFDISDLLLPESSGSDFVQANNYEMVVDNLEENNVVLGLDAANYPQRSGFDVFVEDTDGPLPMSAFDLESLEKFLVSEEFSQMM